MPARQAVPADPRDRWARPGSKLRRVLDRLWAAHGRWVMATELHHAYGLYGWTHDSAIAQLRAKGLEIISRPAAGRDEYEYRLIRPPAPGLRPHLARTERAVRAAREQLALEV